MTTADATLVKARLIHPGARRAPDWLPLVLTVLSSMSAGGIARAETNPPGIPAEVGAPSGGPSASSPPITVAPAGRPEAVPNEPPHGPSSRAFLSHHFQWAAHDDRVPQVAVNFGLLQLALGGFNVAGELRYRRVWLEYSHGLDLTLNDVGGFGLSSTERQQDLHVYVPYTTGFGVGVTLLDELWLGVEFKDHKYEVNAPGGPAVSYNTYSIGPVLGYKLFIVRGLFANAYLRYWPTVATTLDGGKVTLQGTNGPVVHDAHDWGLFANLALGYAFDL
jgi:hypothetical protein